MELLEVVSNKELTENIEQYNPTMLLYLKELNLPTDNVLTSIDERKKVINGMESAISNISVENRSEAFYLTNFVVSVASGQFNAALNCLWNETVLALRKVVVKFDLPYIFQMAEKINSRYKNLKNIEDLELLGEHDLLEICKNAELIDSMVYTKLEYINYMRNHASLAHPNGNILTGYELLSMLEICINNVINAKLNETNITLCRLLNNIRNNEIPDDDISAIGNEFAKLSCSRADDLLWSFFGMYTDLQVNATAIKNISKLSVYIWNVSSETMKFEIGAKFGFFRKNGEVDKKERAEQFLNIVSGLKYKDEDSLVTELIQKLGILKSTHFAWDNFYNEYLIVQTFDSSIPGNGIIPKAALNLWVKVICICYAGNGKGNREGIDESAVVYYDKYITNFKEPEIIEFLFLFSDIEFTTDLDKSMPDKRMREIAKRLKNVSNNTFINQALDCIITGPVLKLSKMETITKYKELLSKINRIY